jgi:hypothetical protein
MMVHQHTCQMNEDLIIRCKSLLHLIAHNEDWVDLGKKMLQDMGPDLAQLLLRVAEERNSLLLEVENLRKDYTELLGESTSFECRAIDAEAELERIKENGNV